MKPITEIAQTLGLAADNLIPYGKFKAKIPLSAMSEGTKKGKLIVVTGITPAAIIPFPMGLYWTLRETLCWPMPVMPATGVPVTWAGHCELRRVAAGQLLLPAASVNPTGSEPMVPTGISLSRIIREHGLGPAN